MRQENEGDQLIQVLIQEHQENRALDSIRKQRLKGVRQEVSEQGQLQMREITQKLNRLQKTLLKKNVTSEKHQIAKTSKDKYEEFNNLNKQLKAVLLKPTIKSNRNIKQIQGKVINLYNNTVNVLNTQDKLHKKLHTLQLQEDILNNQINETKTEVQNGSIQLHNIRAQREANLRRLKKLQVCFYL